MGIKKEVGTRVDESTEDYLARLKDNYDGDTQETYVQRRIGIMGDEDDYRIGKRRLNPSMVRWWILVLFPVFLIGFRIWWTYMSGEASDSDMKWALVFLPMTMIVWFYYVSWITEGTFWRNFLRLQRWHFTGSHRRR